MDKRIDVDYSLSEIQEMEVFLKLLARFPFLFEIIRYYDHNKDIGSGSISVLMSGNEKVANKMAEVAELDKQGLRQQKLLKMGASRLNDQLTDIYTFGNGPCFIAIINGDSLCHLPMPYSQFVDEANLFGQPLNAYVKSYFDQVLTKLSYKKMESLLFFPGNVWERGESDALGQLLRQDYPQTQIKMRPPGLHSVWLGQNPINKTKNQYIAYDSIAKTVTKNF